MASIQEILQRPEATASRGVVIYLTRKAGDVIGYRVGSPEDHSLTLLYTNDVGIVHQYHGHARFLGERKMYNDGARYFQAYRVYNGNWQMSNSGRIVKS